MLKVPCWSHYIIKRMWLHCDSWESILFNSTISLSFQKGKLQIVNSPPYKPEMGVQFCFKEK